MRKLSTFLIFALVIVVNQGGGVTAEDETKVDQVAEEAKSRAVTVVEGPKYVTQPLGPPTKPGAQPHRAETRPPSKPPLFPDKPNQSFFADITRSFFGQYPTRPFSRPIMKYPHSVYPFPKIITMPINHNNYYVKSKPLQHVASSLQPTISNIQPVIMKTQPPTTNSQPPITKTQPPITKSQPSITKSQPPKFSIPVQTIKGIRTDSVMPPKGPQRKPQLNTTTTTTTTTTEMTTTAKLLRTKRIWPKKVPKTNVTDSVTDFKNGTKVVIENYNAKVNEVDIDTSASHYGRVRYVTKTSTTTVEPVKKIYRPVTRAPKHKSTTTRRPASNFTTEQNDWIPIVPSHYPKIYKPVKVNQTASRRSSMLSNQIPMRGRSDKGITRSHRTKRSSQFYNPTPIRSIPDKIMDRAPFGQGSDSYDNIPTATEKEMLYMQSFGLIPMPAVQSAANRKKTVIYKPKQPNYHNPYPYYSSSHSPYALYEDMQTEASHHKPRHATKIKHHHHHHHHKYVKTVEKPIKVPYKVEVPKPYGIPIEKKVPVPYEKIKIVEKPIPYPVTVEKKVPYPIGIKVPQPIPVKVVEKEYIPKPYPIIHHVPVMKQMRVEVPVPQPYPVEKRVPYPVEVKVAVPVDRPVPYPVEVEKKVPYPVHIKVYVPQPYPVETKVPYPVYVKQPVEVIKHVKVNVPQPYPVEVKVPYPVEKRVPYPVEVEKRVAVPYEVMVPQRVEVEKRVPVYVPRPYPVEKRVPYPVNVPYPVKVPVKVPYEVPVYIHHPVQMMQYQDISPASPSADTVTAHGTPEFTSGFQSRSDDVSTSAYTPEIQSHSDNEGTTVLPSNQATTSPSEDFQSNSESRRTTRALTSSPTLSDDEGTTFSLSSGFLTQPVYEAITESLPKSLKRSDSEVTHAFINVVGIQSRSEEATTIAATT